MNTIQAYYNGSVFVPITLANAKINQPAIITIEVYINEEFKK